MGRRSIWLVASCPGHKWFVGAKGQSEVLVLVTSTITQGDRLGYEYKIAFQTGKPGELSQFLDRLPSNTDLECPDYNVSLETGGSYFRAPDYGKVIVLGEEGHSTRGDDYWCDHCAAKLMWEGR